jgi:hypothetical protein
MEGRTGPGQAWQETRVGKGDIVDTHEQRTAGRDGVKRKEISGGGNRERPRADLAA